MGRERSWKMERLFLYLTGSMILLAVAMGCLYSPGQKVKREDLSGKTMAAKGFASAEAAISRGDFPLALQKNEETSARYPGILEDQMLYQRGLLHAHPRNPEQNFLRAMDIFRELKEKFPAGGLATEAEAWVITLENILQKDQALSAFKKDLQKQKKTISQLTTQTGGRQTQIKQLNTRILQLENQVLDLESLLEKLKKVDLGIEEKKRTSAEH